MHVLFHAVKQTPLKPEEKVLLFLLQLLHPWCRCCPPPNPTTLFRSAEQSALSLVVPCCSYIHKLTFAIFSCFLGTFSLMIPDPDITNILSSFIHGNNIAHYNSHIRIQNQLLLTHIELSLDLKFRLNMLCKNYHQLV